jgi:hypothetical protein
MTATAKLVTANLMEESGKASEQKIVILLGVDSKKKVSSKDLYGYLLEAENGNLHKYPFSATPGQKDKELSIDFGAGLESDAKESPTNPKGERYYKLVVVGDWAVGGILTLNAGPDDRFNYKIQSVENAF